MKSIENERLCSENEIDGKKGISVSRKLINIEYKLHWHDFFEIEFAISGSAGQQLNGKEYNISTGTVYMLTPTDFHEIFNPESLEVYNIMFNADMMSEELLFTLVNLKKNLICNPKREYFEKLVLLAEALRLEGDFESEYFKNILNSMILLILESLPKSGGEAFLQKQSSPLYKAVLYMRIHFRENPKISSLAGICGLNTSYFCKSFHRSFSLSPGKYLSELKLDYASKLLRSTDLSVTEICFACGYASLSNFLKAFSDKFLLSPTKFRNLYKKSQKGIEV